ncbi:hypothetical protein EBX31_06905 [bacterium]|nr:hypothetical protein [bacterium]
MGEPTDKGSDGMPRGAVDPNGTMCEAMAKGISRRAVQKQRKKLLKDTKQAVAQAKPVQLVLDGVTEEKNFPEDLRIDPLLASGRAGAIEEAIALEVKEAIKRGAIHEIKILTSSWLDVCKCIRELEPLADERIRNLQNRLEMRAWITRNYDQVRAIYGDAFIRAWMPSKSEVKDGSTYPLSEEEADRLLKLEENPDQRKLEDSPELWRSR